MEQQSTTNPHYRNNKTLELNRPINKRMLSILIKFTSRDTIFDPSIIETALLILISALPNLEKKYCPYSPTTSEFDQLMDALIQPQKPQLKSLNPKWGCFFGSMRIQFRVEVTLLEKAT